MHILTDIHTPGQAHERHHNAQGAAVILAELLRLQPPPEVALWDIKAAEAMKATKDEDGADPNPAVCATAPSVDIIPGPIAIADLKLSKNHTTLLGGEPSCPIEVEAADLTRSVLKAFKKASAPMVVR